MAGPITWRNVDAPSLNGISSMYENAGKSVNAGFNNFSEILKQREALANQNWDQQKLNNTEEFYRNVSSQFATPEAYQEAVRSGAIQSLMGQYGAQIDQAGARKYMEERPGILQERAMKDAKFTDDQKTRADRPIVNSILTDLYAGKSDSALTTLSSRPDLINAPELQKTIADYKRMLIKQGQEDRRFQWDEQGQQWKVEDHKRDVDLRNRADAVEAASAEAILGARQTMLETGAKQGVLAKNNGLPVTPQGLPDYQAIEENPALTAKFKALIQEHGYGMPSDSQTALNITETLRKRGMRPEDIAKVDAKIRPNLNTSPTNMLMGNDKETYDTVKGNLEDKQREIEANNSLFISSKNVTDKIPNLMKTLKEAGKDEEAIRIVVDEVSKKLKENPKDVLHIPAIVASAGTSESWNPFNWSWSKFRTNFNNNLGNMTGTEAYRNQVKEYETWQKDIVKADKRRAKNKILSSAGIPTD